MSISFIARCTFNASIFFFGCSCNIGIFALLDQTLKISNQMRGKKMKENPLVRGEHALIKIRNSAHFKSRDIWSCKLFLTCKSKLMKINVAAVAVRWLFRRDIPDVGHIPVHVCLTERLEHLLMWNRFFFLLRKYHTNLSIDVRATEHDSPIKNGMRKNKKTKANHFRFVYKIDLHCICHWMLEK